MILMPEYGVDSLLFLDPGSSLKVVPFRLQGPRRNINISEVIAGKADET